MTISNVFNGKNVLITGHTGFKGSWLSLWLKQLGAKVSGISIDIPSTPSHFVAANLSYEIDDIASFSLYNIKKRGFSSCINRGLWVDFIYVKPEKRRRGYFTKMIKYFEELLYDINSCLQNENPVECIELLVYKTNNNAVRQYQRLGFIEEPSVEFDGCCMHMVKYFRSKLRHFT